ncbi:MAG: hypothetical protein D6786_09770 [Gammaproteobacteria bacterium]|nr:MAG: hypothetical protein D6786_09770 [Gammaproteobacteria bacterium]
MVEYTVVLFFGLLLLFKAFSLPGVSPSGHDTGGFRPDSVPGLLLGVMKDNFQGYSYTMSLSDVPDYDTLYDYLMDPNVAGNQISPAALLSKISGGKFTQCPTSPPLPSLPSWPPSLSWP